MYNPLSTSPTRLTRLNLIGSTAPATSNNSFLSLVQPVLGTIGNTIGSIWSSNAQVDIANAQLEATKLQQEALIKQYELQYQTKLSDAQKQALINQAAKQEAEAAQKRTETYVFGGIGALVLLGTIYAIVKK